MNLHSRAALCLYCKHPYVANVTKTIDIAKSTMLCNTKNTSYFMNMKKTKKSVTPKQITLIVIGSLSLVLGGIGILLPVLPTTPFVLVAAGCFSGSSPRLAQKLEESKLFGSYLRHWRTNEGVPIKTKIRAIIWLWLGLIVSSFLVRNTVVIIILGVIGIIVTLHLVLIKTKREESYEIFTSTRIDS